MTCDIPMQPPLHNDIHFYSTKGRTPIRARWENGQLILDSEFLIINKTGFEIEACVGSNDILLPTDESIVDLSMSSHSIKFKMDNGYSESIKPKELAEGELCVTGKTQTFYIHLELSNDENYPGVKVITIRNAYYIINTIGEDLFVRNTDGNVIILEKDTTNKPIPLVLAKSSSKNIVPIFSLSFSHENWSKKVNCIEGNNEEISILRDNVLVIEELSHSQNPSSSTNDNSEMKKSKNVSLSMNGKSFSTRSVENISIEKSKTSLPPKKRSKKLMDLENRDLQKNVIVSVRKYGKNQCIVIENATLHNCKFKIINDTKYTLSYNWSFKGKPTEQSAEIQPKSQMQLKVIKNIEFDNIYLNGEFIEHPMKISLKKVEYYGLLEAEPNPIAIYSNLIKGTLVLTITDNHMKLVDECPLYILDSIPNENTEISKKKRNKKSRKQTSENLNESMKQSKGNQLSKTNKSNSLEDIQTHRIEKPIIQINFTVPSIGIDVIDQRRVELVYGRIINVNFNCSVFTSYTDIACNVDQIQLDNSDISSNEEVVLSINKTENQPAFHMSTQIIQNSVSQTFFYIPFFTVLIQPIIVGIESKLITMLYEFYKSLDLKFDLHMYPFI